MIIPPKQVDEIMELTTFISCWVPTFYRYTDADRSAILRSINLVSSQYPQIHVISLKELEHVSENSKWQRRGAFWGTKRHAATLSITLALGLPSNFLNKLSGLYFLLLLTKHIEPHNVHSKGFVSIVGYALFTFWKHDLKMESVGEFY